MAFSPVDYWILRRRVGQWAQLFAGLSFYVSTPLHPLHFVLRVVRSTCTRIPRFAWACGARSGTSLLLSFADSREVIENE